MRVPKPLGLKLIFFLLAILPYCLPNEGRAAALTKGPISPALFCEALLWTGVSSEAQTESQAALTYVRQYLKRNMFDKNDLILSQEREPLSFYEDQVEKEKRYERDAFLGRALVRLTRLAVDLKSASPDISSRMFEIRGVEQIRAARDLLVDELNEVNPSVVDEVWARHPKNLWQHFAQRSAPAALGLASLGLFATTHIETASIAAPLIWAAAAQQWWTDPQRKMQRRALQGFADQLQNIDDTLGMANLLPMSFMGGDEIISGQLHNAIMRIGEGPLSEATFDALIDSSECLRCGHSEKVQDGSERYVQFDSVYYYDPYMKEPVWLLFYRAFANKPEPPPIPPNRRTGEEDQFVMTAGPYPLFVPVKVPKRRR